MNNQYFYNNNCNHGGIYKAYLLDYNGDFRVYVPGIANNNNLNLGENRIPSLIDFGSRKDIFPKAMWNVPDLESQMHETVHPCWVTFENGNSKRPIVMGWFGKGIMYSSVSSPFTAGENYMRSQGVITKTGIDDSLIPYTPNRGSEYMYTGTTDYRKQSSQSSGGSSTGYKDPLRGKGDISAHYGRYPSGAGGHKGLDISVQTGTDIYSLGNGTVISSGWDNNGLGNYITIELDDGNVVTYGHMNSRPKATVGTRVTSDTVVGVSGSTGNSTGPHVHIEIGTRENGYTGSNYYGFKRQNPENYINR